MTEPARSNRRLPQVTDRATWQARIDQLRVKEKAHTRAGDTLAAQRRRLPMVEVDPTTKLIGAGGPVPLIDIFDGRSQLIAYFQMWHTGRPAAEQCEGCTFSTTHINELSYLNSRDVSYATFCQGPYEESSGYRDFMGWTVPWYSVPHGAVDELVADRHFGILVSYLRDGDRVFETYWTTGRGNEVMAPSYGLLNLTVYGRQEFWEDSPEGWPQRWGTQGGQMRLDGRPTAQWSRIRAGRDDDLGTTQDRGPSRPPDFETQREPVPRVDTGELDTALAFLDFVRSCVLKKAAGLTDEQLRRAVVPSGTSILGLIQHLTVGERFWFGYQFAGIGEDADFDFDMAVPAERSGGEVLAEYRAAIQESNELIRRVGDPEARVVVPVDGEHLSLRWVIAHATGEATRHAGHADILRELIDGATGR